MFDIGFPELLLVAIIGLLVIGPERLPEALRTAALWLGRLRRGFTAAKAEIEKEIGMDEVRRQLHNESVMAEFKRIEQQVGKARDAAAGSPAKEPMQGDAEAAAPPAAEDEAVAADSPRA